MPKGDKTMRLVTRSDFDGLACGALLKEAGIIDCWKFAHPKDLQDGLIPVDFVISSVYIFSNKGKIILVLFIEITKGNDHIE